MIFYMSVDEIYEKVLKVPANRRRLPVFEKLCDPSGYITRDGYFVKDDGRVHKSYAATVIAKEGSLCPGITGTSTPKGTSGVSNNIASASLFSQSALLSNDYFSSESFANADSGESSRQYTSIDSWPSLRLQERNHSVPKQEYGRPVTKTKEDDSTFNMYPASKKINPEIATNHVETQPSTPIANIWTHPTPSHGCTFCRTNGERPEVYESHTLKDALKRVMCPVLQGLTCTVCGATGEDAHTITYCPVRLMMTNGKPVSTTIALKRTKVKSNGKRRFQ